MNQRYSSIGFLVFSILFSCSINANDFKIKNIRHLFDLKTGGNRNLALPADVAVTSKRIYVVDGTNNRIVVFDHNGKFDFSIGESSRSNVSFNYPVGMTAHKNRLYIADTGNHMIKILDLDGNPVSSFKVFAEQKEERPIDIAVSKDGREIFVTCNNSHRIHVYNNKGKLLRSWGGPGERNGKFRYPATITTLGNSDKIIVDVLNSRAQVFTSSGKFIRSIGGQGVVAGKFFRPKGVAVDSKDRVYISDSYMDVIQVFDKKGKFLHLLAKKYIFRNFTSAAGIAIFNDRIYVTEVLDSKVSVYKLN